MRIKLPEGFLSDELLPCSVLAVGHPLDRYKGMIGSSPAAKTLEKILGQIYDPKLTTRVMKHLQSAKKDFKQLQFYCGRNPHFFYELRGLLRQKYLQALEDLKDTTPAEVFTYWRNVMISYAHIQPHCFTDTQALAYQKGYKLGLHNHWDSPPNDPFDLLAYKEGWANGEIDRKAGFS